MPHRAEFGGIITNLTREMELAGVDILKCTEVTEDSITDFAPETVIVVTGATSRWSEFDGRDDAHVLDAWQVPQGDADVGISVVVADWRADWISIGIAGLLAQNGHSVRLAVNGYMAGQSIQMHVRDASIARLRGLGVKTLPFMRLFGADEDCVYLQHIMTDEGAICEGMGTLVLCLGHTPANAVEDLIRQLGL